MLCVVIVVVVVVVMLGLLYLFSRLPTNINIFCFIRSTKTNYFTRKTKVSGIVQKKTKKKKEIFSMVLTQLVSRTIPEARKNPNSG